MKKTLLLFLLFCASVVYAQVPARHQNGAIYGGHVTAPTNPIDGQVYYSSVDKVFYYWNSTAWTTFGTGGAGGTVLPTNQIGFGNGTGIIGATDFLWNPTTKVFTLGTDGSVEDKARIIAGSTYFEIQDGTSEVVTNSTVVAEGFAIPLATGLNLLKDDGMVLPISTFDPQTLSLGGVGNRELTISGSNTVNLPSGVTSIIAGAGIDIDQATGDVTISAATGGGTVTSGNEFIQIALSDFVSEVKEGVDLGYFRMPYGGTLIGAKASLLDAGTVTGVEIDILKEDLSILSTNLTTDATEKTSLTATTPYVISDDFLPYDTQLTFDVIGVPTSAKGLIITLEIEKNVIINTEDWVYLSIPLSDLTTDLTTGADKGYFRMPYAATLLDATITLKEAGTVTGMNVDILKNDVSILSTALTTDATENTSVLATTPLVISTTLLENDSQITFSFNGVPVGGKGAIITLIYTKN